jgi:MFS family permease
VAGETPERSPATIVLALGVAQIFGWGSSYYLLGALAKPIADETGWSLVLILSGLSLALLIAGGISPRMGRTVARRGGKVVLAASTLLIAFGLVLIALSRSPVQYLLGWSVMGLGMGLGLYDAAFAALGTHFGSASRKLITAMTLIAGFSSTLTWPLSLLLLGAVGWRGACLVYAALEITVCLPLYFVFSPTGAATVRPGTAASDARGHLSPRSDFYILGVVLTLTSSVTAVLSVNLISIIVALGVASGPAVGLATLLGPAQIFARLLEMVAGRRYHPTITLALATGCLVIGILLLRGHETAIVMGVLVYGVGVGAAWVARGTVPMAIFGPETYAIQMGRLARPALIAQAVAPTFGAFLMQRLGVEATLGLLVAAALTALAFAIALARRSPPIFAQPN